VRILSAGQRWPAKVEVAHAVTRNSSVNRKRWRPAPHAIALGGALLHNGRAWCPPRISHGHRRGLAYRVLFYSVALLQELCPARRLTERTSAGITRLPHPHHAKRFIARHAPAPRR
jgi:hypothetical protein